MYYCITNGYECGSDVNEPKMFRSTRSSSRERKAGRFSGARTALMAAPTAAEYNLTAGSGFEQLLKLG